MFKLIKVAVVSTAILGLLATGAAPANAGSYANLTYAQFIESEGFKDLQDASKASAEFIATQSGLVLETNTQLEFSDLSLSVTSVIEATKSGLHMTVASDEKSAEYWIIGGKAYVNMSTYLDYLEGEYPNNLLKLIPNGATKIVQMNEIPDELTGSTPDLLFSPDQDTAITQTLAQYETVLDYFRFSEVTKQINQDDANIVDYEFDMSYDIFGQVGTIHEKATFNDDLLTTAVITTDNGAEGHSVTTATYAIKNDLVLAAPASNKVITQASVTKVIIQEQVKSILQSQGKLIIAKASTLAKKAKAKVAASHLQSAASSLKIKYTKITNGIKISTTIAKIKGNLCITAVKGKTSTKTC
jgi:hypothetical protein